MKTTKTGLEEPCFCVNWGVNNCEKLSVEMEKDNKKPQPRKNALDNPKKGVKHAHDIPLSGIPKGGAGIIKTQKGNQQETGSKGVQG